jgi:fumarate reductase flavoprotein subunit
MKTLAAVAQLMPKVALRPFVKSLLVVHMQPSPKLFESGAILVNTRGERFCEETQSTLSLAHQPGAMGYLVFDETIATRFSRAPHFVSTAPGVGYAFFPDYQRARPDLVHRAQTIVSLADLLKIDAVALGNSVASTQGRLKAPFVALGPVVSTVTVTEGGLAVDAQCGVTRADGSRIPGLFAAGGVAQGGMRLSGHGLHIGWAIVSGRLSGEPRLSRCLDRWGPNVGAGESVHQARLSARVPSRSRLFRGCATIF